MPLDGITRIELPTLHPGQVDIFSGRAKLNAVRCGRRFGKTLMMVTLAANAATHGLKVGLFTPEHKQLQEPFGELIRILGPIKKEANKMAGVIKTTTGGQIDFWYLNDNELAGRGREYDLIIVDEAAYTKDTQIEGVWKKAIEPTMLTKPDATVWAFSTPKGSSPDNFFWKLCNDETWRFKEFYAPSDGNPLVTPEAMEKLRLENDPRVYRQEYLAEFVDWSGDAFFALQNMLVNGEPVEYPRNCDGIYAVVDTAVKTGQEHDGTGLAFFALGTQVNPTTWHGHPLTILDWEYQQIQGAHLEQWLPSMLARGEELAVQCKARGGFRGVYIEDAQSGAILLQQCKARGWPAFPLPSELTAAGKDARAINASAPVFQGKVKWSRYAYDKTVRYKGQSRNHMRDQVHGFVIGDKDAAKRADDLLDCLTYGVVIGLGSHKGYA